MVQWEVLVQRRGTPIDTIVLRHGTTEIDVYQAMVLDHRAPNLLSGYAHVTR